MELTLDDLEARLSGVAVPLVLPFTAVDLAGFFLEMDFFVAAEVVELVLFLRLAAEPREGGVGDRDVALEELGVDRRDREELGVSERSCDSRYFGFCTLLLLLLRPEDTGVLAVLLFDSCSSASRRRCVFDRSLELVRPVILFTSW